MKKVLDLIRIVLCAMLVISLIPVNSAFAVTDNTGPVITDFRLDENGRTLTVGNEINVSAAIQDNSEIKNAHTLLTSKNSSASGNSIYNYLTINMDYNSTTGRWEGTHTIGANDKGGTYKLYDIMATDQYNNQTIISGENANLKNISVTINTSNGTATEAITDNRTINQPAGGEWLNMDPEWRAYLIPYGSMATGWNKIDNKTYFFNANGWMVFGWQQIDGVWYYFYKDGSLATDTVIDGCTLNSFGACVKNSPHTEASAGIDRWVAFDDGEMAYQFADGRWAHGWLFTDGPWYYFKDNGMMVTGWYDIGGSSVYFSEDGCLDPYKTIEGWCFGTDGNRTYGWRFIDEDWYYLNADGWPVTGWQKIDGLWLFFDDDGVIDFNKTIERWCQEELEELLKDLPELDSALGGGVWIMDDDGRMAYQFSNGDWAHGMQFIDGLWYYFDANGWMVTGWQEVDGMLYYFSEDGSMDINATREGWVMDIGA